MAIGKYDYIIWDWNGTLYNDVFAGMETVNDMLKERGIATINFRRYREIFEFPIINYYEKAGFDFTKEPYEQLAAVFIEKNNARLGESKLYPCAQKILKKIEDMGVNQLILSATRSDILLQQVKLFGIETYFTALLGKSDFYAHSKTDIAKAWIKAEKINPDEILLIGDTVHDYEVSKEIGCGCILIRGGHQSKRKLLKTGAKVLSNIKEILKEI